MKIQREYLLVFNTVFVQKTLIIYFKSQVKPWLVWCGWLERLPVHQRVSVRARGVGLIPVWEVSDRCFSPSLSFSLALPPSPSLPVLLPSSLSQISENISLNEDLEKKKAKLRWNLKTCTFLEADSF